MGGRQREGRTQAEWREATDGSVQRETRKPADLYPWPQAWQKLSPGTETPPRKGRQERDTREPMTSRPADLLWPPNGSTQREGQALPPPPPPRAADAAQVRERLQVSEEKRNEGREEMHKANLSGDTLEVVW